MTLDTHLAAIAVEEAAARGEVVEADELLAQLDQLARGVRMPPTCSVHEAVARLNLHLFDGEGFVAAVEDYGQPESSLLDRVLERRRALPILLCAVYMEVARRCGVSFEGVGFPGHFLIRPASAEPMFYLDPYHRGRVVDEDRLRDQLARVRGRRVRDDELAAALRPVPLEHIRIRVDNNLKGARLRAKDVEGAIRATRRMLEVVPHLPGEQRELAVMRAHVGRVDEAVAGLTSYLAAHPDSRQAADLTALLAELQRSDEPAEEEGDQ